MKKLAPIIITIIVCAWITVYIGGILMAAKSDMPPFASIMLLFFGMVCIGMLVAMIWTLVIRLREINKEDKDDISKY